MWRSSWHRRRLLFFPLLLLFFALLLLLLLLSPFPTFPDPFSLFFSTASSSSSSDNKIANSGSTEGPSIIWSTPRAVDWRPCGWWKRSSAHPSPEVLPPAVGNNGYIRVDCYGGLNQMRRGFCDGIGIARLLNATLVLPKFEVAAYWNESSGFADVFDVDYFIEQTRGFVQVVKEMPVEIASSEPYRVDCSKRKGPFDYIETVLPVLLEHRFISITPAMSQRGDRYPCYAKVARCQGCYNALRLNKALEAKGSKLLAAIPKPFISLHLRFEPDMVAYSQCDYTGLTAKSLSAIDAARGERRPWTGDTARAWRNRGKCPLTPKETAFILQALKIPTDTSIYLASGDGVMEMESFTNVYANVYSKSSLLSREDFVGMHGNTKAALDYYVSINSDAYISTYFGNMDKMVTAMRALNGLYKTLALDRRAFANFSAEGLRGEELAEAMWKVHADDFAVGRGSALPYCFCEFFL